MSIKLKYYRWRRDVIKNRAKKRQGKQEPKSYWFIEGYMSKDEKKKYRKSQYGWWRAITNDFTWGEDVTGRGLTKENIAELSRIESDDRRKVKPSVPDTHIDVTFENVTGTGKTVELPLYNGSREHPRLDDIEASQKPTVGTPK